MIASTPPETERTSHRISVIHQSILSPVNTLDPGSLTGSAEFLGCEGVRIRQRVHESESVLEIATPRPCTTLDYLDVVKSHSSFSRAYDKIESEITSRIEHYWKSRRSCITLHHAWQQV